MKLAPAVMVHGLEMAQAALRPGRPVTLLSAEGAAAYAGVGWWQALVGLAHAAHPETMVQDILDCGDSPGRALEALRARQALLVLRAPRQDIQDDITGRAAGQGSVVLPAPPPALDLGQHGAYRHLAAWLDGETPGHDGAFG
jgi:hypothetical protein